jgi:rare lipoprotein A
MPVRLEVLGATPARSLVASAPPPPRAAAPVAARVASGARAPSQFLVQLGAYRNRQSADQVQREVARRFPDARVTFLDAGAYGVQLGPYGARRSAEARAEVVGRLGYPATVLAAPDR